jgi:hypothetical protein
MVLLYKAALFYNERLLEYQTEIEACRLAEIKALYPTWDIIDSYPNLGSRITQRLVNVEDSFFDML